MNPYIIYMVIGIHHVQGFFLQITFREISGIPHHVVSSGIGTGSSQ